jgi:FtsH-binding integral membrane protein
MLNTVSHSIAQSNAGTMGHGEFMFAITAFVAAFIVIAMLGSSFSYSWTFRGSSVLYIGFILACAVVAIVGGSVAQASPDPFVSTIGGAICALLMGMMIGPFVGSFEKGIVVRAFVLTAGIVLVTGLIGALLPQDLSAWGAPLLGLLLGAIVMQFGSAVLSALGRPMRVAFTALDWAILILFSLMMVYDLNRAKRIDPTLDNAIDVAVNVFLNAINILIRILALMDK